MNHNVSQFCERIGLPIHIEQAFISYCQSLLASRYEMKPTGDTIKKFVAEMNENEILDAWQNFVRDVSNTVPRILA